MSFFSAESEKGIDWRYIAFGDIELVYFCLQWKMRHILDAHNLWCKLFHYVCIFHMFAMLSFSYLLEVIIFDIDYAIPFRGDFLPVTPTRISNHRRVFDLIWSMNQTMSISQKKFGFIFSFVHFYTQYSSIESDFSKWRAITLRVASVTHEDN